MSGTVELWRPVEGTDGDYEVSSLGNVRSVDRTRLQRNRWGQITPFRYRGRKLALQTNHKTGYIEVQLGSKFGRVLVHRLVASHFIQNPCGLDEVNHKDGVRANNELRNLEWMSSSDNKKHSYRELERKPHGLTQPVRLRRGAQILDFPSALAAARHLAVVAGSIRSALKRDHLCRGWEVLAA